eukprot:TRINITY_DN12380_c0_g1_i12.p3 TRINITY_DN12380_c0_g1~~TRINITY_DN12380_c0_g1_i12.p3  ORF type:complete len:223 (+),score=50.45 TRINITY_DN12380_c0_g1_i12:2576-3244(+)
MARAKQFAEIGKKIVCVGRNYGLHAKEMGEAVPTSPLLFLKPTSSLLAHNSTLFVPQSVTELHHEVELGIVIEERCQNVPESAAMQAVGGYLLAFDMTARNIQSKAKKAGNPWSVAKGYDGFCPVSDFISKDAIADPHDLQLSCSVEGTTRQDGNTKDMIFKIPTLIHHISQIFTLEAGDVILTGTPEGVGPITAGQTMQGTLKQQGQVIAELSIPVAARDY